MTHPYDSFPDRAFWRRAVAETKVEDIDPVGEVPFLLSPNDKIATAGSCFAQHIGRYLNANEMNFLVTEQAHPFLSEKEAHSHGYGLFSARYGNVYTARQLMQLLLRAQERFQPLEDHWRNESGRFFDPFRPRVQPGGFESEAELKMDRQQHFDSVRRMLESLDVFIFTLGLTECWRDRRDGAVFPLCPGVVAGEFDAERHEFHNFTVAEVVDDMTAFITALRSINPSAKVILTVSPVPLIATAVADRHVLTATVYSKSVLRVACEQIIMAEDHVAYFPSYEIITGSATEGRYFGVDRRTVTEEGVAHVMGIFLRRFVEIDQPRMPTRTRKPSDDGFLKEMKQMAEADCDEEMLDFHRSRNSDN